MNKNDFNKLDIQAKAIMVFEYGKYIGLRYYYNHAINLYSLNDFFVEVWYFAPDNKMAKIGILEKESTLNLYIDYMNEMNRQKTST